MATRLPLTFATPASGSDYGRALATAQAAETAGFTSVALGDRPHDPELEGWTLASAILARTQTLRVFHTTLNLPYRLPQMLAREAATLDVISGGRLDLCLGAGGERNRPMYESYGITLRSPGERLRDLRYAITLLRGMWREERYTFLGEHFRVEAALCAPKPVNGAVPIWVGAIQPRILRLAGEVADGWIKNQGWASLDELKALHARVDAAAEQVGRDPTTIRCVLNGAGFVGESAAEVEAYRTRTAGAPFGNAGLVGTTAEVIEMIGAYRAAGVDTFNVRFPPDQVDAQLRRFGAEVIAATRDG